MTWQTIAASETDANSPLNQTLLDKIRGNLDDLHAGGAQLLYLNAHVTNNLTAVDVALDEARDWRDRLVEVKGVVFQGTENDIATVLLGGSNDDRLGSHYGAPLSLNVARFDDWMYTSDGGASKLIDPHISRNEDGSTNSEFTVWVDSTSGALKLHVATSRASGSRNLAYLLRLIYSADLGGH